MKDTMVNGKRFRAVDFHTSWQNTFIQSTDITPNAPKGLILAHGEIFNAFCKAHGFNLALPRLDDSQLVYVHDDESPTGNIKFANYGKNPFASVKGNVITINLKSVKRIVVDMLQKIKTAKGWSDVYYDNLMYKAAHVLNLNDSTPMTAEEKEMLRDHDYRFIHALIAMVYDMYVVHELVHMGQAHNSNDVFNNFYYTKGGSEEEDRARLLMEWDAEVVVGLYLLSKHRINQSKEAKAVDPIIGLAEHYIGTWHYSSMIDIFTDIEAMFEGDLTKFPQRLDHYIMFKDKAPKVKLAEGETSLADRIRAVVYPTVHTAFQALASNKTMVKQFIIKLTNDVPMTLMSPVISFDSDYTDEVRKVQLKSIGGYIVNLIGPVKGFAMFDDGSHDAPIRGIELLNVSQVLTPKRKKLPKENVVKLTKENTNKKGA